MNKKIGIIVGTRPEIIKISPVIKLLIKNKSDFFIVHTNQHYHENMDLVFFKELKLPKPKYNLNVKNRSHASMTGEIMIKLEKILNIKKPDWVLIEGDTNTVLAAALTASKMNIKIGHVEAGLRSYDRNMPEELNRIVADHLSSALFAPTIKQKKILIGEGIEENKIFVTGNTIVDAVYQNLKITQPLNKYEHYRKEKYLLLTLHRPSNVDSEKTLSELIKSLENVVDEFSIPIYFPVHPRTKDNLGKFNIKIDHKKIRLLNPVGYLEMLVMEKNAKLILTDSGGIQEEACILKTSCITLRNNTERPETLEVGSNMLSGYKSHELILNIGIMLKKSKNWSNPFGDGHTAKKIVDIIS